MAEYTVSDIVRALLLRRKKPAVPDGVCIGDRSYGGDSGLGGDGGDDNSSTGNTGLGGDGDGSPGAGDTGGGGNFGGGGAGGEGGQGGAGGGFGGGGGFVPPTITSELLNQGEVEVEINWEYVTWKYEGQGWFNDLSLVSSTSCIHRDELDTMTDPKWMWGEFDAMDFSVYVDETTRRWFASTGSYIGAAKRSCLGEYINESSTPVPLQDFKLDMPPSAIGESVSDEIEWVRDGVLSENPDLYVKGPMIGKLWKFGPELSGKWYYLVPNVTHGATAGYASGGDGGDPILGPTDIQDNWSWYYDLGLDIWMWENATATFKGLEWEFNNPKPDGGGLPWDALLQEEFLGTFTTQWYYRYYSEEINEETNEYIFEIEVDNPTTYPLIRSGEIVESNVRSKAKFEIRSRREMIIALLEEHGPDNAATIHDLELNGEALNFTHITSVTMKWFNHGNHATHEKTFIGDLQNHIFAAIRFVVDEEERTLPHIWIPVSYTTKGEEPFTRDYDQLVFPIGSGALVIWDDFGNISRGFTFPYQGQYTSKSTFFTYWGYALTMQDAKWDDPNKKYYDPRLRFMPSGRSIKSPEFNEDSRIYKGTYSHLFPPASDAYRECLWQHENIFDDHNLTGNWDYRPISTTVVEYIPNYNRYKTIITGSRITGVQEEFSASINAEVSSDEHSLEIRSGGKTINLSAGVHRFRVFDGKSDGDGLSARFSGSAAVCAYRDYETRPNYWISYRSTARLYIRHLPGEGLFRR